MTMADAPVIATIYTARGHNLQCYRNWECEGAIRMLNAKTIGRYEQLRNMHPDPDNYGVWFAFSKQQYEKNKRHAIDTGMITEQDEIVQSPSGLFGTRKGIEGFLGYYDAINKMIAEECDPQEVYFYEYNNHECMIDWDGDKAAYDLVVSLFGRKIAEGVLRIHQIKNI